MIAPAAPTARRDDGHRTPRLSICIPTYRRRRELETCVESILASARLGDSRIDLVVSDNASPDDTSDYLSALREREPDIRVFRQVENIGAERNIYALAELAQGEWIWLLGDDDRLEPEAIETVLKMLECAPPALVLNYSVWSADFARCIKRARFGERLGNFYETSDDLMRTFGVETGYCSALVVRRDHFLSVDRARYEVFSPFGFAFLYAFYSGARTSTGFRYVEAPIVMNRAGNSSGFDWYKYFVSGTTMVLDRLGTEGYSALAVSSAKTAVIGRFVLRDILVRKRDGADTSKIFGVTHEAYRSFALFWLGIVPALAIPAWFVRWAHRLLMASRQARRALSART